MRRIALIVGMLPILLLTVVITAPAASASSSKLFVAPGTPHAADSSCSDARYNSIQAAVTAAHAHNTIIVCAGIYPEEVTITKALTIKASGSAVIRPTAPVVDATDPDLSQPVVGIVDVQPGAGRVNISGLTVDGSVIEPSVNGCDDDLVGVLYQSGAAGNVSGRMKGLKVENITPMNSGCGSGLGIFVQSGGGGSAVVNITSNTVSGYGKNGITCEDLGTSCSIKSNTITTTTQGPSDAGQNGVQMSVGAIGPIEHNTISGNYWTGVSGDSNPEVQSDYASGILLYGAGINSSGATTTRIPVENNTLTNDQSGVEIVDSSTLVTKNHITESGSGIPGSVGIFGVGCDVYCSYFNATNGKTLTETAQTGQAVTITSNTIDFTSSPSDSYGIWLGDDSWVGGNGYAPPAGSESAHLSDNSISNVTYKIEIGGGATA